MSQMKNRLKLPGTYFFVNAFFEAEILKMPFFSLIHALRIRHRLIFTNVIHCSRLRLSVGYFIYFKFARVSSIVYQYCYLFSSIKETNWLISKEMCVFLFDVFNGCSVVKKQIKVKEVQTFTIEKSGVLKTCPKGKFIGNKI